MRSLLIAGFVALFLAAGAVAQTAPPAAGARPATGPATAAPPAPGPVLQVKRGRHGMTRDEFIERARRRAAERFDRLDTDHDGILQPEERRAGRANKKGEAD